MKFLDLDFKNINYKNEILSGLTVAIILVPEAIAFSLIAGVSPIVGLYAAFIMGLVTAIIGGRPGMISGATGAIALVLLPLIQSHGADYLYPAIIVGGLIQLTIGALKLGKFIRLIPHPVMIGFVNGLGVMIFTSQFEQFKTEGSWMHDNQLYIMVGLVALTMIVMYVMPKITKAVPGALVSILIVTAIVLGLGVDDVVAIGSKSSIKGAFPSFSLPVLFENPSQLGAIFLIVLPYSFKMAAVGLIESLLTLSVIDDITQTRGSGNKESVAQGVGNVICGFFGGMGGCVTFGQSMLNMSSGARTRISSFVAALSLLAFVVLISQYIEMIPMAALVGVMFMIAIETVEWSSLRIFKKMPIFDVGIVVVVTAVTIIFHDLALAVLIGVVLSALNFAWGNAVRIRARKHTDDKGNRHYEIYGPLFFASSQGFMDKFDVHNDPDHIFVDFTESRITDMSGIEAIRKLDDKYKEQNKKVTFTSLSVDCQRLLATAQIDIHKDEKKDPTYAVIFD